MLSLHDEDQLVPLDDNISLGGMSDDLMAIIDDEDTPQFQENEEMKNGFDYEDMVVPLSDGSSKEQRDVFRDESIRSLRSVDSECWIDDELFVDAVDVFEDEDDAIPSIHQEEHKKEPEHFFTNQGVSQPKAQDGQVHNNVAFEEYWNAKMAQLARSMKRSEATRNQVIRQREILLAEQKRQEEAQQTSYFSSAASSFLPSGASNGMMAFAQQGRRLNGFMSSMTPNVL